MIKFTSTKTYGAWEGMGLWSSQHTDAAWGPLFAIGPLDGLILDFSDAAKVSLLVSLSSCDNNPSSLSMVFISYDVTMPTIEEQW